MTRRSIALCLLLAGLAAPAAGQPAAAAPAAAVEPTALDQLARLVVAGIESRIAGVSGAVAEPGPPEVVVELDSGAAYLRPGAALALLRPGRADRIGVLRCLEVAGNAARCRVVHLARGFRPEAGDRVAAPAQPVSVAVPPVDDRRLEAGGAGDRLRRLVLGGLAARPVFRPIASAGRRHGDLTLRLMLYRQAGRITALAQVDQGTASLAEFTAGVPVGSPGGGGLIPRPGRDPLGPGAAAAAAPLDHLLDVRLLAAEPGRIVFAALATGGLDVLAWSPPAAPVNLARLDLPVRRRLRGDCGRLWTPAGPPGAGSALMAAVGSAEATFRVRWDGTALAIEEELPAVLMGELEVAGRPVAFGGREPAAGRGFGDGRLHFPGGRELDLAGFPAGWVGAEPAGDHVFVALGDGRLVPYDVGTGEAGEPIAGAAGWARALDVDGDGRPELAVGSASRCDAGEAVRLLDPADFRGPPLRIGEPFPAPVTGLDALFAEGAASGWLLVATTPCNLPDEPTQLHLLALERRPE